MKQANPDKMIMIVDNKITQMDEDDTGKFKFRKIKIVIPVKYFYIYRKMYKIFQKGIVPPENIWRQILGITLDSSI